MRDGDGLQGVRRAEAAKPRATGAGRARRAGRPSARRLARVLALGLVLGLPLGFPFGAAPLPAGWLPFGAAPARAQASTSYTLTGIPAEATAENGVLAKERALAAGRRIAWERLAAQSNATPPLLSDEQIEQLTASIVIEQERATQARYTGRITVNFIPGRAQALLGGGAPPAQGGLAGGGPGPGGLGAAPAAPASSFIEARARYASLQEWLELRQRLRGAAAVASIDVLAIAVDGARLRLGLRSPAPAAAAELGGVGVALQPMGGEIWQLGLGQPEAGRLPGRVGLGPRG